MDYDVIRSSFCWKH